MDTKTYNGWTNYETWDVTLWLDNDEGLYNAVREKAQEAWNTAEADTDFPRDEKATQALAEELKEMVEEAQPDLGPSIFSDLLNAALSEVNWHEIAASKVDEVDKG